jgi:hypothetical protein
MGGLFKFLLCPLAQSVGKLRFPNDCKVATMNTMKTAMFIVLFISQAKSAFLCHQKCSSHRLLFPNLKNAFLCRHELNQTLALILRRWV